MKLFDANIHLSVFEFLKSKLSSQNSFETANQDIFNVCGILDFFPNQSAFLHVKDEIGNSLSLVEEPERAEYGDFQTNINLTKSVLKFLHQKKITPTILIEPTCGKGNFILAALQTFQSLKKVIGIEIYPRYVWEAKFSILHFYLYNPAINKPLIEIFHFNVFDFNFKKIAGNFGNEKVLIIGNPPWVTNSKLSSLESDNLPKKSNFKNYQGLDAITGKGNFDIGESITLMMFDVFQHANGYFAFLVKNSVIKNVIFDQRKRKYSCSDFQKLIIDSKKEFNVSVEASLLYCKFNSQPEFVCDEFDFYIPSNVKNQFGWVNNKFVSNIEHYKVNSEYDGICPFEWRQGLKHDLSSVMEFEKENGRFINSLKQIIDLEEDLIYGILKSSDLKDQIITKSRKFTLITQKKVGQDTSFIKKLYPKTYQYLSGNKSLFELRKSSIYNDKPDFSIFGIGDYSFAPYKVSISALYKNYRFSLIIPEGTKPLMVDDTCYMLGFDELDFAVFTFILLSSLEVEELLKSITFMDSKRVFTKEILMRIDLFEIASQISMIDLKNELEELNEKYNLGVKIDKWDDYLTSMKPFESVNQLSLF